jgi:putative membrane protein
MLRRSTPPSVLLLAVLLAGAPPALAAAPTSDADFLQQAARTEFNEAQMGQLAIERSSNRGVKKLGRMLIDDHAATGQEAAQLADPLQVSLPTNPTEEQQETYRSLSGLEDRAFDKAFVEAVIKSSRGAIDEYEAEAQSGDAEIAAYADEALPLLQRHLEMARMLRMRTTEHNTP